MVAVEVGEERETVLRGSCSLIPCLAVPALVGRACGAVKVREWGTAGECDDATFTVIEDTIRAHSK